MEEQTNNFIGGLNSDFNSQNQPPNTYRSAQNWVRGLDGSLSNEMGTTVSITGLPPKKVLGSLSLEDDLILFFQNDEIGYVRNNIYTSIKVDPTLAFTTKLSVKGKINYKKDRVVYFVDGVNEDKILTYNTTSTLTSSISSLSVTAKTPVVKFLSVGDTGVLPTGVYQMSARLLTASGNKATVSLPTNPIPIINETTGRGADGAPPQTPSFKSINIEIINVDPKFEYIEIISTTYQGITSTPISNVVGTIKINGSSTYNFTYDSLDQNGSEVTLDELTIDPIAYKSSSLLEMKDGYLFRANLKATKEGLAFQAIANNTTVKWITKELDFSESISLDSDGTTYAKDVSNTPVVIPYKDPYNVVELKSRQRGEVYSIALVPKFKDGSVGFAYHIPCLTAFDATARTCEGYPSTALYPAGYGYHNPNGFVMHFRMPTLSQVPMTSADNSKIVVLGLEVSYNLSTLTAEERSRLEGIMVVSQRRTNQHKSILTQGIAQPLVLDDSEVLGLSAFHGKPENDTYKLDTVAFYSPDTIFDKASMLSADQIQAVAVAEGTGHQVGATADYKHTFLDFNRVTTISPGRATKLISKNTIQYIPTERETFKYNAPNAAFPISTLHNNGFLFFNSEPIDVYKNTTTKDLLSGRAELSLDGAGNLTFHRNGALVNGSTFTHGDVTRLIHNLISIKAKQYGDVLSADYVLDSYHIFGTPNISKLTGAELGPNKIECFNGDTYINKVAIVSTTRELISSNTGGDIFNTLNYVFLESTINTALRHYLTESNETGSGTVPYFPKYRNIFNAKDGNGLLNIDPAYGHSNGYNKQYSFDSGLKKFFSKQILNPTEVYELSNRVIYSEVSIEGEQYDANRVFLPNNYHDIPKSKGGITDMFVQGNTLYLHTPQTLYRTFTNEQTALVSTSGEVVTGNGGLFPRPSIEMTTVTGGYGGCYTSNGSNTPYGRMWIDQLQKKIFILGERIEDITEGSISSYLSTNCNLGNYVSGYDYKNKRWILSGNFTLSYQPSLKSFSSYHSYTPHIIVCVADRVFLGQTTKFEELNTGVQGKYFGVQYPCSISVISNENPLVTKSMDNIALQSTQPLSSLKVISELKSSNTNNLLSTNNFDYELVEDEILVRYKNNQYQFCLPRATDSSRFKEKWCELQFSYDNTQPINLKYLTMLYRVVSR